MIDAILEEIEKHESVIGVGMDCAGYEVKRAGRLLSMLRRAVKTEEASEVADTLYKMQLFGSKLALDAIREPMLAAQRFVFERTGEWIEVSD